MIMTKGGYMWTNRLVTWHNEESVWMIVTGRSRTSYLVDAVKHEGVPPSDDGARNRSYSDTVSVQTQTKESRSYPVSSTNT